jgi:hypothetical protein
MSDFDESSLQGTSKRKYNFIDYEMFYCSPFKLPRQHNPNRNFPNETPSHTENPLTFCLPRAVPNQ